MRSRFARFLAVFVLASGPVAAQSAGEASRIAVQIGHRGAVGAVALSPDGELVASGGSDGRTLLWDVASGRLLHELPPPYNRVLSLDFTPDGSHLVVGQINGTALTWDVAAGAMAHVHDFEGGGYCGAAVSADGRLMAVGADRKIAVLEVATGREIHAIEGPRKDRFWDLAFTPDGKYLASASDEVAIYLWRMSDARRARELKAKGEFEDIAFDRDGATLHGKSRSGVMTSWDMESGRAASSKAESSPVAGFQLAKDGGATVLFLVSGEIARVSNAGRETLVEAGDDPVGAGTLRGDVVVTGHESGRIRIRSLKSGKVTATLEGDASTPFRVRCTPAGALRVAVHDGKSIAVIHVDGNGSRIIWETPLNGRSFFALSPDGGHVAFGHAGEPVSIIDLEGGKTLTFEEAPRAVGTMALSVGGRHLAQRVSSTQVVLHDRTAGIRPRSLPGMQHNDILGLELSPDGAFLAQGGKGNFVRILDLAASENGLTYEPIKGADAPRHDMSIGWVRSFAFDAEHLLCGGPYAVMVLRDRKTLRSVRAYEGHHGSVSSVAFGPDGARLFSTGGAGQLMVWDRDTGARLATMRFFADGDWIALDAEGRLQSTPGGRAHVHGVTRDSAGARQATAVPEHLERPGLMKDLLAPR